MQVGMVGEVGIIVRILSVVCVNFLRLLSISSCGGSSDIRRVIFGYKVMVIYTVTMVTVCMVLVGRDDQNAKTVLN
jgi:hypothetical protein